MPGTTAVFYMGLARLAHIVEQLLACGAPAARPAAIIVQGTTAQQRVITATLGNIRDVAATAQLVSPALLIVGEVVGLHATLAWFNAEPALDAAGAVGLSRTA
jgi:uroporphyrin-III C-methyltransferase/precorrin-2 dehydrogenase/sirohydrochlorin ferrochelatase